MNKLTRFLAIGLGVVLLLVVVLAVLVKLLITPERVRETVLPLAEKALQRPVALEGVEISFFSGIALNDLVIREREGGEVFVAVNRALLRYRFWPLLQGRVMVDEVILAEPRIRVVRRVDGRFNFSDLLETQDAPDVPAPAVTEEGKTPLDLLISRVAIQKGTLEFLDQAVGAPEAARLQIADLTVSASQIALDRRFPLTVQFALNQARWSWEGTVDPRASAVRGELSLNHLDLLPFSPYYQGALPGDLTSGQLGLELTVAADPRTVVAKGTLALTDLDLMLDAAPDLPLRQARIDLDYDLRYAIEEGVLDLSRGQIALNHLPLQISGRVESLPDAPRLDVRLDLPELEVRAALASLPAGMKEKFKDLDPSGTLAAQMHLSGGLSEPLKLLQEGEVKLGGVEVSAAGQRPRVTGRVVLQGDMASADALQLRLGDNLALVSFSAPQLFATPLTVSSQIRAERLALDSLLPATPPAPEVAEPSTTAVEIGPFDLPLRLDGTVQVGAALYRGVTVQNLLLRYRLENNLLTVETLEGQVAGGSFRNSGRVDLARKGLAYSGQVAVQGVDAATLVDLLVPKARGTVFGTLNLDTQIEGQGTLAETWQKTLAGKGTLSLRDGRLTGSGLVQDLADFLNLDEFRELNFNRAAGTLTLRQGRVNINSEIAGGDVHLVPRGSVGLDGTLDVALPARFSPELTAKLGRRGEWTQFLSDSQGRGELPLKLAGTLGAPRFTLDTSAVKTRVQEEVKEKAREEIQKQLEEKVFKKLAPKEGEGDPAAPTKKLLEETFKGLFGK